MFTVAARISVDTGVLRVHDNSASRAHQRQEQDTPDYCTHLISLLVAPPEETHVTLD